MATHWQRIRLFWLKGVSMTDWKKTKCGTCVYQRKKPICNSCLRFQLYRPMTNADRIRSMSDEELAEFLDDLTDNCCRCAEHQNCGNCQIGLDAKTGFCDIKKWLQSEAE